MKPWRVFGLENQAGYVAGKPKGRMRFLVVIFFLTIDSRLKPCQRVLGFVAMVLSFLFCEVMFCVVSGFRFFFP